jgi:hypothetical protein
MHKPKGGRLLTTRCDCALLLFAQSGGLGLRAHPVSPAGHEPGVDENEGVSE